MKKVLDKDTLRDPDADWSRAKGHIGYNPTQEEKYILQQAKDFSELTPKLLASGEINHLESGENRQSQSSEKNQSPELCLIN